MNKRANGTFNVEVKPLPLSHGDGTMCGRNALDKQFHGDLDAKSQGEMLTAGTPTNGSAAYVAIERVVGTLHGRSGSFVFHHTGTMHRGDLKLVVAVAPDSGTDELVGLTGQMTIHNDNGKHSYDFDYSFVPVDSK